MELATVTLALVALEYKIRVTLDDIACSIHIPADGKAWKTASQFALNTSWMYIEADIDVEYWYIMQIIFTFGFYKVNNLVVDGWIVGEYMFSFHTLGNYKD